VSNLLEPLFEIFSTLSKNKLRTLLTALSVAWGMFMLVILLGAGRGLQNGVEWEFRDDAVNSISFGGGMTSIPYKGRRPGRDIVFENGDYDALPREIPRIDHISGRFWLWGEYTVSYRDKHSAFDVIGVHPDHRLLEKTEIVRGRYVDEIDIAERRKVAVIGAAVKDFLFGKEDPIGDHINIRGLEYMVVGVFEDIGGEAELRRIFVPISTAQLIYKQPDRIHRLTFTIGDADVDESQKIAEQARRLLAASHDFSPDDRRAVRVQNNLEQFVRMTRVFAWIRVFVWVVGIGTLLAGIVGISNIMLISVAERTREIGVRKALGATPGSIIRMIMAEAVLLTASAGYLGLVAGVALVELVAHYVPEAPFLRNPSVDIEAALMGTALIVIASALAGFFPAWRAARVNPIVALRDG
jgi:putative ABC transport system permease protein